MRALCGLIHVRIYRTYRISSVRAIDNQIVLSALSLFYFLIKKIIATFAILTIYYFVLENSFFFIFYHIIYHFASISCNKKSRQEDTLPRAILEVSGKLSVKNAALLQ